MGNRDRYLLSQNIYYVVSGILALACLLSACATPTPSLERLYETATTNNPGASPQPPVILVHGAFGARLCRVDGTEIWPGTLGDLVFSDYRDLGLPFNASGSATALQTCGLADTVAGKDFYGRIENTLTGPGGYTRAIPGAAVVPGKRYYYRFTYDWRQDNAVTAQTLDAFVEQVRRDHDDDDLQVDIVAHSMGGLATRYWLRYGTADVLQDNAFPINNAGGTQVRKVVLLGTPNLGSAAALQQLLSGADFAVNTVPASVLLTFPSAYQLLPHPIVDSVLGDSGGALDRDIFDRDIWRALEWGPFDPEVRKSLGKQGWRSAELAELERYAHKHLERARRFVWSLTVENSEGPYELIVFGGDCVASPARILIENIDNESHVRLWPDEVQHPQPGLDYAKLMLEPGDGAVTKASLLARTALDPSVPRHRFSDFPLDYAVMFCEDHSQLPGNLTFQDNLLHILLAK